MAHKHNFCRCIGGNMKKLAKVFIMVNMAVTGMVSFLVQIVSMIILSDRAFQRISIPTLYQFVPENLLETSYIDSIYLIFGCAAITVYSLEILQMYYDSIHGTKKESEEDKSSCVMNHAERTVQQVYLIITAVFVIICFIFGQK